MTKLFTVYSLGFVVSALSVTMASFLKTSNRAYWYQFFDECRRLIIVTVCVFQEPDSECVNTLY